MNVLFVTWDGPQVFYLEGLFLPIFHRLTEVGIRFHVLQFTWGPVRQTVQQSCERAGVSYQRVDVLRGMGAVGPMLSAMAGAWHVSKAVQTHGIDVVMPRSTLPALVCLLALRGKSTPMVFDADGLSCDERVDFTGLPASGATYRLLREIEAQAVRRADVVLTRTLKATEILMARAGAGTSPYKFHVVSNGRDADRFNPGDVSSRHRVRMNLGLSTTAPLIVYAGSLGPQYCMTEMFAFFSRVRTILADAHFLILTGSPQELDAAMVDQSYLRKAITVLTLHPDQVPDFLASADLGLALREQTFSMQAVAPIKLAEYLLCGLPVLATTGVGDTSEFTTAFSYFMASMDAREIDAAVAWFINNVLAHREHIRETARSVGVNRFSLQATVEQYKLALGKAEVSL